MPWEVQYIVVIIAALIRPSSLHSMHRWCNDKETLWTLDTCGKAPIYGPSPAQDGTAKCAKTHQFAMTQIYPPQESTTEGGGGGCAFQTSQTSGTVVVVEYEWGWSEFAPIIYPFKGHFLCYWLAVVHTWQLSFPGEAVSRGTRPTWNAHTGEEIGLETNRHTEDAAARWGN